MRWSRYARNGTIKAPYVAEWLRFWIARPDQEKILMNANNDPANKSVT